MQMPHTSLENGKQTALGAPNKLVAVQDIVIEALQPQKILIHNVDLHCLGSATWSQNGVWCQASRGRHTSGGRIFGTRVRSRPLRPLRSVSDIPCNCFLEEGRFFRNRLSELNGATILQDVTYPSTCCKLFVLARFVSQQREGYFLRVETRKNERTGSV